MAINYIYALEAESYLFDVKKLVNIALSNLDKVLYVSLNRSAKSIKQFCADNKISADKIFILDLITPRFKTPSPEPQVVFFNVNNNPDTLTEKIVELLERFKCDALLFDSLSTLELYYEGRITNKIVHDLLAYTDSEKLITLLLVQKSDIDKPWLKAVLPLVDQLREVKFDQQTL